MSTTNNLFSQWQALFARGPRQTGTVAAYADGVATITLPGGGTLRAVGDATVGAHVYVRDGVIEGPAPDLPVNESTI